MPVYQELFRGQGEKLAQLGVEGLGNGLADAFHVAMRATEWFGNDFVGNP